MPDIPRDPRQLARDILSGKVRIEDLAKERQRAGGAGGLGPPPIRPPQQARMPDKIPLPRPATLRPAPQRPVQRVPAPVRTRPPQQQKPQQPRPTQARPVPPPVQRPMEPAAPIASSAYTIAPQAAAPIAPTGPAAPQTMADAMAQTTKRAPRNTPIGKLLRNRNSLRDGIMLSEVLGKPLSIRDW